MHKLTAFFTLSLLLTSTACREDTDKADDTTLDSQQPLDTGPADSTDSDGDGFWGENDCDDADAAVNPDAEEVCDGIDNNCDGSIDGTDASDAPTWYLDSDGDGYGIDTDSQVACDQPHAHSAYSGDCDDTDASFHPGASETDCTDTHDYNCDGSVGFSDADSDGFSACEDCDDSDETINEDGEEICDDIDNDCDQEIDEDATDAATWYGDADGDGFGGSQFELQACDAPAGYVANTDDCDDVDDSAYPGASEVCDEADNDCDGTIDEGVGFTWYADTDGDGYGDSTSTTEECDLPPGYSANGNDCDDTNPATNPSAYEICDGIDNNCDGTTDDSTALNTTTWYQDADSDGYGSTTSSQTACSAPSGYVDNDNDCDDTSSAVSPAADEYCDSVDNDCDGSTDESSSLDATSWYADDDSDGYGSSVLVAVACNQPSGSAANTSDCDDTSAAINPQSTETCDGADNDCDGVVDENNAADASTFYADTDSDGFGNASSTTLACSAPSGYVTNATDCNDSDASSTTLTTDADCDGTVTASDCDDNDASSNTTANDADCDGTLTADDCDDNNANSTTRATDADCDGALSADDCNDSDASSTLVANDADCDGVETANDCNDTNATTGYCDSCQGLLSAGLSTGDGTYTIDPTGSSPFDAYCDMTSDGGGWTLLGTVFGGDSNNWNQESGNWASTTPIGSLSDPWSDFKSEAWYSLDISTSDILFVRSYAGVVRARSKLAPTCQGGKALFNQIFTSWDTSIKCGLSSISVIGSVDSTGTDYPENSVSGLNGSDTNGFCWNGGDSNTNVFKGHAGWNQSSYSCYAAGHLSYLGIFTNNGYPGLSNSDFANNNWMSSIDTSQVGVSFFAR